MSSVLSQQWLDAIRSQAEAGEFAHYGGMMVQDLLNHIDALQQRLDAAEQDTLRNLTRRFADALYEKLKAAEQKYGYNHAWERGDWQADLVIKLLEHVEKGDPLDVAAYCAFAWHHKWSLSPGTEQPTVHERLDAAEQRAERYREALEAARHSLTTLHGLWATDEDPSVSRYEEAVECGLDNHAILDGIVERSWHLDESVVLEQIDAALTEQERD